MKPGALQPHEADIIAWNIEGVFVGEQLKRLSARGVNVTQQALHKFRTKHAGDIEGPRAQVKAEVVDRTAGLLIADKTARLRDADTVRASIMDWVATYGLVTAIEHHKDNETYTERRFESGIVKALVDILKYGSQELGQFQPDAPPQTVQMSEFNATFQTLILSDPDALALAERAFVRAAMGAHDALGTSLVHKRRTVAPGAAPDADQQRPGAHRPRRPEPAHRPDAPAARKV